MTKHARPNESLALVNGESRGREGRAGHEGSIPDGPTLPAYFNISFTNPRSSTNSLLVAAIFCFAKSSIASPLITS